jgi:hypothetical protein
VAAITLGDLPSVIAGASSQPASQLGLIPPHRSAVRDTKIFAMVDLFRSLRF